MAKFAKHKKARIRPGQVHRPKLAYDRKRLVPGTIVKNLVSLNKGVVCDNLPTQLYVGVATICNSRKGPKIQISHWYLEHLRIISR